MGSLAGVGRAEVGIHLGDDPETASDKFHLQPASAALWSRLGRRKRQRQVSSACVQVKIDAKMSQSSNAVYFTRITSPPWGVWLGRNKQMRVPETSFKDK